LGAKVILFAVAFFPPAFNPEEQHLALSPLYRAAIAALYRGCKKTTNPL
jgi:hypothetical protein